MTTKALSELFVRHADIISRTKTTRAILAKIAEDREAVMEKATGADDEGALAKLNVLATQETLATRELALNERQFKGIQAMLLNEAVNLRTASLEALQERREKLLGKLDATLARWVESGKKRTALLDALNYGKGDVPQADPIAPLHKVIVGLNAIRYIGRETTPEAYANSVLGKVERALEILAEK